MNTLYFAADYHNSMGIEILNPYTAEILVAEAVNKAEDGMRDSWNKGTRDINTLKNTWYAGIISEFQNLHASQGLRIQVAENIIISEQIPIVENYVPCN